MSSCLKHQNSRFESRTNFYQKNTLIHKSLIVEMITKTENFRQYFSCFLLGIRVVFRKEVAVLEVTYFKKHITVQEYAGHIKLVFNCFNIYYWSPLKAGYLYLIIIASRLYFLREFLLTIMSFVYSSLSSITTKWKVYLFE